MIFSRIGSSVSRSKNAINGSDKWSSVMRSKGAFNTSNNKNSLNQLDSKLGFVRGYLAGIGAKNGSVSKAYLSDFCYFLANPKARRFFSTETPKKKNYQIFYPKDKKGIPKNEQKSESKEEANAGDRVNFMKNLQNLIVPFIGIGLFLSLFPSSQEEKHISFQEFKNKLLEPGLVERIVVTNKSVAKVYVRSSPQSQTIHDSTESTTPAKERTGRYECYFNIGSVDSFEEKLEEAQRALGIDTHDFVPVTYVSQTSWFVELMKFALTLLLLGSLVFMSRGMQGGLGIGGGGGKGARGIFSIGKAPITKVDKNAKDKVVMASQQVGRWKINYPSKSLTQTRLLTTETRTQKLECIADTLIDLNRIERHDYVILLRHKMGLTRYGPAASAPGPMSPSAGGGATTDSAAAKEKTAFDVKLEKFEASAKLKVIKEIRSFTDLGLKEAKDLVEKTPAVVKKGVTKEEGEKIVEKLKELGVTVVLE